jgi:hypothetical protein
MTTPIANALFEKAATPQDVMLLTCTAKGRWLKAPATVVYDKSAEPRIRFVKSDMLLKDEIKSMTGSKWHHEATHPHWSIADSQRNRFQFEFLLGGNPYSWFDRPIEKQVYKREALMTNQRDCGDQFCTYHSGIDAEEMGLGKTLAQIEHIERSGVDKWIWVTRANLINNTRRMFEYWQLSSKNAVEVMSYEAFVRLENEGIKGDPVRGIVFDEASALKNPDNKRSSAAQRYSALMRSIYGHDAHVTLMTGTPAPKNPAEWWGLCEIAYPGFLREGSLKALDQRLGIFVDKEYMSGQKCLQPVRDLNGNRLFKDDEKRCSICGVMEHEHADWKQRIMPDLLPRDHDFRACKNEVAYLYERLKGLVFIRFKKDVLAELPEKTYRIVECKPQPSVVRSAKMIADGCETAMEALMKLRELSDGFQYVDKQHGETKCPSCVDGKVTDFVPDESGRDPVSFERPCYSCNGTGLVPNMVRETVDVGCPKDAALVELLEENDECGRLVVFGAFDGTLDRIQKVCHASGWAVVRCDGKGLRAYDEKGKPIIGVEPLDVWANRDAYPRVAWDANPESGGLGFTLVEAHMAAFYSNTYKTEYRAQGEDRIHRKGMDINKGCVIVDFVHLPSDMKVLTTLKENRRLEKMTLGELQLVLAA